MRSWKDLRSVFFGAFRSFRKVSTCPQGILAVKGLEESKVSGKALEKVGLLKRKFL